MSNPIQSAVRAVVEGAVERIAAWNRKRLPQTEAPYVVGIHKPIRPCGSAFSRLVVRSLDLAGTLLAAICLMEAQVAHFVRS